MLPAYIKALAQTQYLEHNYSDRPTLRDLIAGKYTPFPNQRHNPSASQLTYRQAMRTAAACWTSLSNQERLCYDQLAHATDTWRWPLFLHDTLAQFASGHACNELKHPYAHPRIISPPNGSGAIELVFDPVPAADLILDAWVSSGDFHNYWPWLPSSCYTILVQWNTLPPTTWITEYSQSWDPTSTDLTHIQLNTPLQARPDAIRYVGWIVQLTDPPTAPVFDLQPSPEGGSHSVTNYVW